MYVEYILIVLLEAQEDRLYNIYNTYMHRYIYPPFLINICRLIELSFGCCFYRRRSKLKHIRADMPRRRRTMRKIRIRSVYHVSIRSFYNDTGRVITSGTRNPFALIAVLVVYPGKASTDSWVPLAYSCGQTWVHTAIMSFLNCFQELLSVPNTLKNSRCS